VQPLKPFVTHTGVACPLALTNIDTDQLIPGRFLKLKRGADLGRVLLHDLRFSDDREVAAFPLNQVPWRAATVLVARRNFGCGSSREAAVYALEEFGIRAVLAPSFGDIFASNAVKNGVLPVVLSEPLIDELLATLQAKPELPVHLDLEALTAGWGNRVEPFAIDAAWREQLLNGWDDLEVTRARRADIVNFKARDAVARPWASAPRQR
jgi:3-isopropylmalate/(R)-2-methylmalate dehydratase small subunit